MAFALPLPASRPVPVPSLPDSGSLINVGVEVQVVTTAIAPELQRKDPPQETLQQQDKQLLPPVPNSDGRVWY
jgi:hypothetical protein